MKSPYPDCLALPPAAVECVIRTTLMPSVGLLVGAQCAPYNGLLAETP